MSFSGYEIRHGTTKPTGPLREAIQESLGWSAGSLLGVSVRGLLEDPDVLAAVLVRRPSRSLAESIDELTDRVMGRDVEQIDALVASGYGRTSTSGRGSSSDRQDDAG